MDRRVTYGTAWVASAVVAVLVGVAAVGTVGASIRGRGPLGEEVPEPTREIRMPPDADAEPVADTVAEEFGEFDAACQGATAYGLDARPDREAGWRVVSYEPGPDDDVDAVFSNGARSIEFEVFCNRGVPTLSDYEENTLPDD